jgi:hypothetical protein
MSSLDRPLELDCEADFGRDCFRFNSVISGLGCCRCTRASEFSRLEMRVAISAMMAFLALLIFGPMGG